LKDHGRFVGVERDLHGLAGEGRGGAPVSDLIRGGQRRELEDPTRGVFMRDRKDERVRKAIARDGARGDAVHVSLRASNDHDSRRMSVRARVTDGANAFEKAKARVAPRRLDALVAQTIVADRDDDAESDRAAAR
jgi:hypothetical protein